MQFRDLGAQYAALKDGIDAGIARVLEHGRYIGGPEVAELEARLAGYVGARHCVTCANGTDALQLALMAWGVGPGDAVLVPDFTFFASGEAPALLGATPVFVDVDERTFNLDAAKLEEAVRFVERETDLVPRVVVAVDLFGLPADYPAIRKVCERHGLLLLEDGAQGFGGSIDGRMACSFGDVSTTSFFPAKPLGCYGDGGAVFTDSDEWAELVRSYAVPEGYRSSWAQYTVRLPEGLDRDALQAALKERGVPTMVYYPKPMHGQGAFEGAHLCPDGCPVTKRLCETVLSLPMGPYLTADEVLSAVHFIDKWLVE